jgi:hypothetical protein
MGLSRQRERAVAIQRYRVDGVDRMLVPMWLNARRVVDVRGSLPTWSFGRTSTGVLNCHRLGLLGPGPRRRCRRDPVLVAPVPISHT